MLYLKERREAKLDSNRTHKVRVTHVDTHHTVIFGLRIAKTIISVFRFQATLKMESIRK